MGLATDRLVEAGKVALGDQVSLQDGAWIDLGEYLASPLPQVTTKPDAAAPTAPAPASGPPEDDEPVLRLLANKRIVAALSRAEVTQLRLSRRIDDEDLVCALYGPWMRVGDFLAPPAATAPASSIAAVAPTQPAPPLIPPFVIPGPAAVTSPSSPLMADLINKRLADVWFVRVRGIHSAPLGERHIRALFEAKEITSDNAARHATWPDNAWLPIHSIPQLADAVT